MPAGITDTIVELKSKQLSNERTKFPITAYNSLSPKLRWINNSKIRVEFKGSCLIQDKVTFTQRNVIYLFIVYVLDTWSKELNANFTLKDFFFGAVKLTKNIDPDKYYHFGYGIGIDSR